MAQVHQQTISVIIKYGPTPTEYPEEALLDGLIQLDEVEEKVMADLLAKFGAGGSNPEVGVVSVSASENKGLYTP